MSIGLASAQLAAPQPPPYQWPRSHDYDVEHYRIAVSFDIVGKSLTGETTITLHPYKDNFKEVELDAGKMKIESVKLAAGSDLKYRYEKEEKLYVELGRPYKAGEDISIVVKYSANPKQGVAYIVPTESDPSRPYQIWTQGQPDTNHYWFPCYDYPNDRATSETIVTVDEKYQVISNGDLISVKPAANKKKTWHWKMDRAYASYLVSVVVGEFDEVKDSYKGKPVISYVPKGQTENGKLSFSSL
ncbi:MAG: hypothetical protein JNN15_13515, partial [Blastocatellia bacterium]|nr:hypothetical protein [Blastocatellia bacterium]